MQNQTFERQILNNYKLAFKTLLRENNTYFRTIDLYLHLFDRVFTTKNIIDVYHRFGNQLKITDIKSHIDKYAAENHINLKQFEQ